jgi:hypothetical protein
VRSGSRNLSYHLDRRLISTTRAAQARDGYADGVIEYKDISAVDLLKKLSTRRKVRKSKRLSQQSTRNLVSCIEVSCFSCDFDVFMGRPSL